MSTLTKAVSTIDNLDDLRSVQNALAIRFKELQSRAAHSFMKGDKVKFETRSGEIITGVVARINQKTVTVNTPNSQWKVSGSLLKRA